MSDQRRRVVAAILVAAGLLASCGGPTARTSAPSAPAPGRHDRATGPAGSTTTGPSRPCPAGLPTQLATTGTAQQLITVEGATYDSTHATIRWWQKTGRCWVPMTDPVIGRVGINGFSDHHKEGDYTTPTGLYPIGPTVFGNAADPGVRGAYHRLVCGDWWDEDPSSPAYNTFQHVRCGQAAPFAGGSEALWTEKAVYPSFAVVRYNDAPRVPGAGSAIFIHAENGSATFGCVSLPRPRLDQLLRWLDPSLRPAVVMAPAAEINRF